MALMKFVVLSILLFILIINSTFSQENVESLLINPNGYVFGDEMNFDEPVKWGEIIKRNLFWSRSWLPARRCIWPKYNQRNEAYKKLKGSKVLRENPLLKWSVPGFFGEF